jgi:hypothetical protein
VPSGTTAPACSHVPESSIRPSPFGPHKIGARRWIRPHSDRHHHQKTAGGSIQHHHTHRKGEVLHDRDDDGDEGNSKADGAQIWTTSPRRQCSVAATLMSILVVVDPCQSPAEDLRPPRRRPIQIGSATPSRRRTLSRPRERERMLPRGSTLPPPSLDPVRASPTAPPTVARCGGLEEGGHRRCAGVAPVSAEEGDAGVGY